MNDPELNRIRQTKTTQMDSSAKPSKPKKEAMLHKSVVYYQPDEVVFNDGDPGEEAYVVVKGKVELFKMVRGKREVVNTVSANSVFGEMALFNGGTRAVSAVALEET